MSEAFFFGEGKRQVFACYHPPARRDARVITVVCPPLFSEFMRSQLALRELADSLSNCGHHVLRFDYGGTGDSFGDLCNMRLSDWMDDIAGIVREGRDLAGNLEVRLLGVRLGALLACRAAKGMENIGRLVLWDPVADGISYLECLSRFQPQLVERNCYLSSKERRMLLSEYAGYRIAEELIEDLRTLNRDIYFDIPSDRIEIVGSDEGRPIGGLRFHRVRFDCRWEKRLDGFIIPQPVMEKVIQCLM